MNCTQNTHLSLNTILFQGWMYYNTHLKYITIHKLTSDLQITIHHKRPLKSITDDIQTQYTSNNSSFISNLSLNTTKLQPMSNTQLLKLQTTLTHKTISHLPSTILKYIVFTFFHTYERHSTIIHINREFSDIVSLYTIQHMLSDYKCIQSSKTTDTSKSMQYFLCNYHNIQRFVGDHQSDESEDDVYHVVDHDDEGPLPVLRLTKNRFLKKSKSVKLEKKEIYKKLIPMINKKLPLTLMENGSFMLDFSGFLRPILSHKTCATFKEKLQFICNTLQFTNFSDCNISCINMSYNAMQKTELFVIVNAMMENVYGGGSVEEIDFSGNFHAFDESEEMSMWMMFFKVVEEKFLALKTLNISNTGISNNILECIELFSSSSNNHPLSYINCCDCEDIKTNNEIKNIGNISVHFSLCSLLTLDMNDDFSLSLNNTPLSNTEIMNISPVDSEENCGVFCFDIDEYVMCDDMYDSHDSNDDQMSADSGDFPVEWNCEYD